MLVKKVSFVTIVVVSICLWAGCSPQTSSLSVVQNVEVDIDLTTYVAIVLQEATVGLEEVVVTSERPIIQRDIAASQHSLSEVDIQSAPLQNVANVLNTNVGVNDVSFYEDRPEIRGSGFDESIFLVDGVD